MNDLSTIAAAVASALQGATLGQSFTAERCYYPPDYSTAATKTLKVLVLGFDEDVDLYGENATRSTCDHLHGVRAVILKRINAGDVTSPAALPELDEISDFRAAVIAFFKANRLMGGAQLSALKNAPAAYDPPTLGEKNVFVSMILLTYRMQR